MVERSRAYDVWTTAAAGHAAAPRRALASVGSVTELLRLSVLDQSPVAEGSTGSQALQNTIDLARLTDGLTAYALQRDRRQAAPDDFPQQLAELLAYFDDSFPDGHALGRYVETLPGRPEAPAPWLRGSSAHTAAGQV